MIDINIVLVVIFLGVSALVWVAISSGVKGVGHYEKKFTDQAETNLENMFLFFDYRKMFVINMLGLVVIPIVVYVFTGALFYAGISLIVLLVLPKIVLKMLDVKRRKRMSQDLPDALAQIAGGMRSGATFTSAIETMVNESKGPISQEFGLLIKEQKIGIKPQDALENLAERMNSEDIDLVVTAALIARDVGGNLAETFERLSMMLRRKIEMEGKIEALTSQGKLQGWVVGLLPFGIMMALTFVEPEAIEPMFTTYLGWGFIAVILILELMGALMIRKLVTIDV
jgi:tight adherence protein B